ncbi:MAG: DUF962 domain-containing protein [Candidatus Omnitrophota bacterium]
MNRKIQSFQWGKRLITDYAARHHHPMNILFHVIGIPEVFWGIYRLITGVRTWGLVHGVLGYMFQWVGHRVFEKNTVGEVILLQTLYRTIFRGSSPNARTPETEDE